MKTRSLLAAGWLLAVVLCLSCGRRDLTEVLDRAEACMLEQPDSALHLLQTVDRTHISGASHRARYALLYSQALDKNYIDVDNDSLIRVAVDYYKRRGDAHEKALAYFYLGRIYDNAGDETQATEAFVEAETHALNTDDHYICGLIYSYLGNLYFAQYSFDEALDMYDKSEKCYARAGQLRNEGYMIEAKARVYMMLSDWKNSLKAYDKAITVFKHLVDTDYQLSLEKTAAFVRLYNNLPGDSLRDELMAFYIIKGIIDIPIEDYPTWSMINLQEGKLDTARDFALKAMTNADAFDKKQLAGISALLMQIETASKNYKAALDYAEEYIKLRDIINQNEKNVLIQKTHEKYKNQQLKNEIAAKETRHGYQLLIIFIVGIAFTIYAFLIIISLIKKRKKMEKAKNDEINSYKILAEDLASNYAELKNVYEKLSAQRDQTDETEERFIKALDLRMKGLGNMLEEAYLFENKPERFLRTFKQYIKESSAKDFAFSDLQYVVNKKYFGIIDYLKETYPNLTESDLDLCSMICFGFSSNSIRQIYAHTNPESIYNKRSKLRNKLKLSPSIQIEGFIRKLLSELSQQRG